MFWLALVAIGSRGALAAPGPGDVLATMRTALEEAERQLAAASAGAADDAYAVSYEVVDHRETTIQGSHGAAAGTVGSRRRSVDVDVRVGTPELDSTHKIRDESMFGGDERARWIVGFEARSTRCVACSSAPPTMPSGRRGRGS